MSTDYLPSHIDAKRDTIRANADPHKITTASYVWWDPRTDDVTIGAAVESTAPRRWVYLGPAAGGAPDDMTTGGDLQDAWELCLMLNNDRHLYTTAWAAVDTSRGNLIDAAHHLATAMPHVPGMDGPIPARVYRLALADFVGGYDTLGSWGARDVRRHLGSDPVEWERVVERGDAPIAAYTDRGTPIEPYLSDVLRNNS